MECFVSITKNEHDETTYSVSMERSKLPYHINSAAWTFVVTYQVKCLTLGQGQGQRSS